MNIGVRIVLFVAMLSAGERLGASTPGPTPPMGCRALTAREWGRQEAFIGFVDVAELPPDRYARSAEFPSECYRADLAQLHSPERVRGYQDGILELRRSLGALDVSSLTPPREPIEPMLRRAYKYLAWRRLQDFAGQRFTDLRAFDEWFEASRAFMVWSDERQQPVVDEQARHQGRILIGKEVVDNLSVRQFWFWRTIGILVVTRETADAVEGTGSIEDQQWSFRMSSRTIADRAAKRLGLLDGMDYLIKTGPGSAQMRRLEEITGLSLADPEAWLRWWQLNNERLVLSPDASRLVTP